MRCFFTILSLVFAFSFSDKIYANNTCGALRSIDSFEMVEKSRDLLAKAIDGGKAHYLTGIDPKTKNEIKILIVEPETKDYDEIIASLNKAENTSKDWTAIKRGCGQAIRTCAYAATAMVASIAAARWGLGPGMMSSYGLAAFMGGGFGIAGSGIFSAVYFGDYFTGGDLGSDNIDTSAVKRQVIANMTKLAETGEPLIMVSKTELDVDTFKALQKRFDLNEVPLSEFFEELTVTNRQYLKVNPGKQRLRDIELPYFDKDSSILIKPQSSFSKPDLNYLADVLGVPLMLSKNKIENFAKRLNANMIYGFDEGIQVPFGYFFKKDNELNVFIWEHYSDTKKVEIIERVKQALDLAYDAKKIPDEIDDSLESTKFLAAKRGIEKKGKQYNWVRVDDEGNRTETDITDMMKSARFLEEQ